MKYFDYEIFGELQNAKIVHKNGFFRNHQFDIGEQIDLFSKVMNKL